ncbi:MAG: siderophore-interacting protein [Pseudomonadota bacterium]
MARQTRTVTVARKEAVSPNMMRVTLTGDALQDFPVGFDGGYVKLNLVDSSGKPAVRSYSIRSFSPAARELNLDMVAHGDTGPATAWAQHSRPGDEVAISGPGACQGINTAADWFLLAGDMSALPAISVNLAQLPPDAKGYAVLEVMSEADRLSLAAPPGLEIIWIINPDPESPNTRLEDTVMSLPWHEGSVAVWVAGEFSASRTLRQYFRTEKGVPKTHTYISCYWKVGDTDEGMKAAKRADPEPW